MPVAWGGIRVRGLVFRHFRIYFLGSASTTILRMPEALGGFRGLGFGEAEGIGFEVRFFAILKFGL